MPKRLISLLALAVALCASGAAVVLLTPAAQAPAAASAVPASAPVELPTVVVRPEPEIPTLAQVTVRPDDAIFDAGAPVRVRAAARVRASTVGTGGFDMPYYSFGKSLRHSSKE